MLFAKPKNVTDKSVTWKSGNKKVATIDENGKVTKKMNNMKLLI